LSVTGIGVGRVGWRQRVGAIRAIGMDQIGPNGCTGWLSGVSMATERQCQTGPTIVTSSLAQRLYYWTLNAWGRMPGSASRSKLLGWTIGLAMVVPGVAPVLAQSAGPVRPELYLGVQSESVSELQAMLRLLGFFRGDVSGLYGDDTQNAVIQFQTAAGILPNGRVNGATWAKLLPGVPVASGTPTKPVAANPVAANPVAANPGAAKPGSATAGSFPKPVVTSTKPTTPAVKPAPAASPMFPILRKGDRGPAVETLQKRLRRFGVLNDVADGVFGAATYEAVVAAQKKLGIEADGIVGPATWDALLQ
jgi:N-acetylmuramoyl-L-alanine amidase